MRGYFSNLNTPLWVCCTHSHTTSTYKDIEWNERYRLRAEGGYVPRFKLDPAVLRVPVVPGSDPRIGYGDLVDRGELGGLAGLLACLLACQCPHLHSSHKLKLG